MASVEMTMDSDRGKQWCEAVEKINEVVNKVMQEAAKIIEEVGNSDQGGSLKEKISNAAKGFMKKFAEMVTNFATAVQTVAEYVGKVVQFATKLITTVETITKFLGFVV